MRFSGWERVVIHPEKEGLSGGEMMAGGTEAVAPVIISASRSTDIPAFYGDWFIDRLDKGYVRWTNPWSGKGSYVSFARARLIAFWSKNPAPFFRHLDTLEEKGFSFYFLYTLNDYRPEGFEPGVPPLEERLGTFIRLSGRLGKGRVVWRFDPLILTERLGVEDLLGRIRFIGDRIHRHTRRLVISFVDIHKYPKVRRNLERAGAPGAREFSAGEVSALCSGLCDLNKEWGLDITACGEAADLSGFGIGRGQCIGYHLMTEEFPHDRALMQFLHPPGMQSPVPGGPAVPPRHLKDPGQRGACGCIAGKDIGQYHTCMHLCAYCYANSSPERVERNYRTHITKMNRGSSPESITGEGEA